MATIRQIEAARHNGSRSPGPVTAEGGTCSSQNALKHGMHSKAVVLSNQSTELCGRLMAEFWPNTSPRLAASRTSCSGSRTARGLNRILTMETAAVDHRMDRQRAEIAAETAQIDEATCAAVAFFTLADSGFTLTLLGHCESRLLRNIGRVENHLALLQSSRKIKKVKNEPKPEPCPLPEPGGILPQTCYEPDMIQPGRGAAHLCALTRGSYQN